GRLLWAHRRASRNGKQAADRQPACANESPCGFSPDPARFPQAAGRPRAGKGPAIRPCHGGRTEQNSPPRPTPSPPAAKNDPEKFATPELVRFALVRRCSFSVLGLAVRARLRARNASRT